MPELPQVKSRTPRLTNELLFPNHLYADWSTDAALTLIESEASTMPVGPLAVGVASETVIVFEPEVPPSNQKFCVEAPLEMLTLPIVVPPDEAAKKPSPDCKGEQ